MLTKQIILKLPSALVRRYGHLMREVTPQELRIKSALEIALRKVRSSDEVFSAKLSTAESKVSNYQGDPDVRKYFRDFLKSVYDTRRELAGYGPSSSY